MINLCIDGTTYDIRWVRGHRGALGNELADEAAKLGSKSVRGNIVLPLAPATMKRKIHEKIKSLWNREWMSDPDWCRQTKYFYKSAHKRKTDSLLVYGKEATSRFVRFITGHAFLRKHNAYVRHGRRPNQILPFDEIKCRMCGKSIEEPAHIIRECEAFCLERWEEFNCQEWPPNMDWTVDQMIRFINKSRVKELEEEQDTE